MKTTLELELELNSYKDALNFATKDLARILTGEMPFRVNNDIAILTNTEKSADYYIKLSKHNLEEVLLLLKGDKKAEQEHRDFIKNENRYIPIEIKFKGDKQ